MSRLEVYSHTTVIVNWHGPFTKEDVKARADWENGLYSCYEY